jgi:DNA-binding transcriptional MerR regulator
MLTIGKLARRFGLSRSTLLYYDSIGLLRSSDLSESGYRLYSRQDAERLERICTYREFGLPLREIARLLDARYSDVAKALERRFEDLSAEILRLRDQQRLIIGILKNKQALNSEKFSSRASWIAFLSSCGFSEEDMLIMHAEFERTAPQKHKEFLEYLGIPADEIEAVRAISAAALEASNPEKREKVARILPGQSIPKADG